MTIDCTPQIPDPITLRTATIEHIRAHPEEWEQEAWRCASGMCFAGTGVMLAGGTFPFPADEAGGELVDTPDGRRLPIGLWASEILTDDETDADLLFAADNTLPDLEHMVARLNHGLPIHDNDDDVRLAYDALEWAELADAPIDANGDPILTPPTRDNQ